MQYVEGKNQDLLKIKKQKGIPDVNSLDKKQIITLKYQVLMVKLLKSILI